jgi:hypothetical protein
MEVAMLTASAAATPTDVSISNTRRFEFASTINSHRYVISVGLPDERCPERGCGVLYVLDGDFYFASAAGAARLGNAPGVVVVGIGYPSRPAFVKSVLSEHQPLPAYFNSMAPSQAAVELERTYDLTLPATDQELVAQRDITVSEMTSKNVGGLDDFLKTIEIDVKPRVAKLVPIDPTNQAIFGHSLGGLAVLHALFVSPGGFNESTAPTIIPPGWGMSAAELDIALQRARMVQNVAELAARLKALRGNEGYVVDYAVFDQQDHGISPWPAIGRGIPFAFKRGL